MGSREAEVDVGPLEQFEVDEPIRVDVGRRALVIVRRGEEVYELRDLCPHMGAPLSAGRVGGTALRCKPGEEIAYGRAGEILTCPWHGWEFELTTGKALCNPERARVRRYDACIRDGRVFVDMGA